MARRPHREVTAASSEPILLFFVMTRVALLLLDDLLTAEGADFADLGRKLIQSAVAQYPQSDVDDLEFTKFDYIRNNDNLPELDGTYDLIYLTGSRKDSYENIQFNNKLIAFLKSVVSNADSKTKLLGICFGHQIIARALDLTTVPNTKGWEMGNTVVSIADKEYQRLNNANIPHEFVVSEMHRDIVSTPFDSKQLKTLSELDVYTFGSSSICSVQGLYKRGKLLSFQGHPEFSAELTGAMIRDKFSQGAVDEEFYKDASARNQKLHEDGSDPDGGLKLQKWIAEFLYES